MEFAKMKNNFLKFNGSPSTFALNDEKLLPAAHVKDVGVYFCPELSCNYHVNEKIKKTINPSFHTKEHCCKHEDILQIESVQYNAMPMLRHATACITLSRSTSRSLENLQKRVIRWEFYDKSANYYFILEKENILPIPMYSHLTKPAFTLMIPATKVIARDHTVDLICLSPDQRECEPSFCLEPAE